MTHITPKSREDLQEFEAVFEAVEASMGFVPQSMLTMAHWPPLLAAFGGLGGTVLGSGNVEPVLKQLIAFVVSNAAGCRYCQAHTSHVAERRGVTAEKIAAAFEFETSDLFDDRERAALRVALHAGMVPNAVESEHMDAMKAHFSDQEIVEVVAVISMFGFLNRWNDTMATTLEAVPKAWASENLESLGWEAGKHN